MSNFKVQDILFRQVRELLPAETSVADAVSEILHLSTDSAYRRIRGETPLVLDELEIICRHFRISIDQLLRSDNSLVTFQNTRVHHEHFTYTQYLTQLQAQLKVMMQFSKKQVIYMSKDLPIFYNFYFKYLIAFRYYFWMRIQVLDPRFEQKDFDPEDLPPAIEEMSIDIARTYSMIPSIEIWNMESINSTISQIEFSRTSGHFKNADDVLKVYDALEASILHVQEQVENGCKFLPGEDPQLQEKNLEFFFNRVVLGDNTIMSITDNIKSAFINYGHLNYLSTNDQTFCEDLYKDFENLKRRSTLISVTGERQRNIFFNILLSKIRERKQNAV